MAQHVAIQSEHYVKGKHAWVRFAGSLLLVSSLLAGFAGSQEASALALQSQQFHQSAQQRAGVLIPLYQYPANVHTNASFNRVIELKREHPTIPFWIIVNPATGPGVQVDANYTKAIDRLLGAGCVVLGYISTEYGNRRISDVETDLTRWRELYPRVQGVFFDEMVYENTASKVEHQVKLKTAAAKRGYWPVVANPGTDTPEPYFKNAAADVIVVHESDRWPEESRLHGNYFGGYSDYPPHTRAVLVHSMKELSPAKIQWICKYAKWVYVTHDEYRVNDPKAPNPWDDLSIHLEALCKQLEK
ncbi:MAG: spherulation-specific family 4 protein [Pirellulales bacterium]